MPTPFFGVKFLTYVPWELDFGPNYTLIRYHLIKSYVLK